MKESKTSMSLEYSFIAVPTNLFYALDNNLRVALTTLLQLQSSFADGEGWFFRSNTDLQSDFKMGKNLTIAVLETLFQHELLLVKSVGFTKRNAQRQVNFYHVNVDKFKDFEKFNIYTLSKNETLHIETVDYKAKGFQVTYTSQNTVESPTVVSNPSNEETPSMKNETPSEGLESGNFKKVVGVEERELQVLENIAVSTDEPKAVESPTIVQKSSSGQVPRHDTENVTKGLEMAKFGNVGGDSKNMKYSEETLKQLEINKILDQLREEAFKLLEESARNCKDLNQLNGLQMKVVSFMGQKCPTSEIQRRLNGVIFNKVSRLKKDFISSLLESPTVVSNPSNEETPRQYRENATEGLESGNFSNCSTYIESADEDFLNEALKMSPIHEKSYRY